MTQDAWARTRQWASQRHALTRASAGRRAHTLRAVIALWASATNAARPLQLAFTDGI